MRATSMYRVFQKAAQQLAAQAARTGCREHVAKEIYELRSAAKQAGVKLFLVSTGYTRNRDHYRIMYGG